MALSTPQPSGDSPTAQSGVPPVSTPATPADFWSHFHVFPLNFENYSFDHWYFYTIGYSVIMALLAIILDLSYGAYFYPRDFTYFLLHDFSQTYTKYTLFNWHGILEVIGLSLIALTFNNWRHSIPGTFQTLLSKDRISSNRQGADLHQDFYQFLEQYRQMLLNKKRYILIGSIVVICMTPTLILLWQSAVYNISHIRFDPLYWSVSFIYFLFNAPLIVLVEAYFFGIGCWVIAVTGTYIKRLAIQFDLHIIPGHPDNCGGLKVLGNFCLSMAFPVLILAMLLGIFGIGGIIVNDIYLLPIISNVFLFLFVLPLAAFTFFVPLWNIHQKMVERRDEYEDKFAERDEQLQQRMQSSLDKHDMEDAKAAREELEILQVLHPDKIMYPSWPFDRSILVKFLTPQIIPFLSLLSGLVEPLIGALRRLFS